MVERSQIYKCEACGNIVTILHGGGAELSCCGQEMTLLKPNTVDAAREKHVPVAINIKQNIVNVQVGSTLHPMEEDHYIEMICVHTENGEVFVKFLKPGDSPKAEFTLNSPATFTRAYCNKHGLWENT